MLFISKLIHVHRVLILFRFLLYENHDISLILKNFSYLPLLQVPNDALDFNLLWTGSHVKPQVLQNLLPHQRLNHFPRLE